MHTGASSIMNVGQISEWNFKPNINENIYPKPCGILSGSAGEFFPPGRDKITDIEFFSPDLCRYVVFKKYNQFLNQFHFILSAELFNLSMTGKQQWKELWDIDINWAKNLSVTKHTKKKILVLILSLYQNRYLLHVIN